MIYERIKEKCDENGISIYKLEKDLRFPVSTIVKWKNSSPTVNKLKAVAEYFEVPIEYFLKEDKSHGRERSNICPK